MMNTRVTLLIVFGSLFFVFLVGGLVMLLVVQYRDTGSVEQVIEQIISPTPVGAMR